MTQSIYIVGAPGSGKSTLMAHLLDGWEVGPYEKWTRREMFGHYLTMVGAIGGRECTAPGVAYSEYENAIGTGQVHLWFDRPTAGWTG